MTLPRVVGVDPEGHEITAANGRYGPYIARTVDGKADYRSLATEDQLFTVTLEEALALYAAPKQRRGQGRAAEPLREIGVDPASGGAITLREGRFGPYVTDGETNASLRKGDEPATITLERAAELLADRQGGGPAGEAHGEEGGGEEGPGEEGDGEEGDGEEGPRPGEVAPRCANPPPMFKPSRSPRRV